MSKSKEALKTELARIEKMFVTASGDEVQVLLSRINEIEKELRAAGYAKAAA